MSKEGRRMEESLTRQEQILLESVDPFYDEAKNFQRLEQILEQEDTPVTLRLLDFLCTTYSTTNPVILKPKKKPVMAVNLKDVYRGGLHAYGKAHYDCFRRNKRLVYHKHGHKVETTLGQLLYFKDALAYGIVDYAEKNHADIKREMAKHAIRARRSKELRKQANQAI